MSTLNELLDLSREIENRLIEADGLITPDIEALTNILDVSLPEKIDGYAIVIDRMEANAEWFKAQAYKYALVQKGLERASENIRTRLKEIMIQREVADLAGNTERFKLSPSKPRLLIGDETKIPTQFLIETKTISPDKDAIRAALTKGDKVESCVLEPSFSLRRYVKK
jgi:hypothetical protein